MANTSPHNSSMKNDIDHVEYLGDPEKSSSAPQYDRFGSFAKVDPKEIALVRKIDLYMMVCILFVGYDPSDDSVCGTYTDPDDQISSWSSTFQHAPQSNPTFLVYGWVYDGLGNCLYSHMSEATTRMAILYTGNMLASAFSGLIAAGVFAGLDKKHGLAGWQWLFLIQGVVTVGVALVAFFLLPNAPRSTQWLTAEERQLADERIKRDTTQREEGTSTWVGLREACMDYRTWIFALMCNLHLSANGFKNFMPTVVKTLGFNSTITLVLTCPPYLVATFTSVAVSWSSGHFNERTWHVTVSKALAIIGFAVACGTLNIGARYFAMILFVGATYGVNNINIAWTAATLGQTDEKKAVAIAITNTLGNLASVYTPYLWPDSDAPRFALAMYCSIGFSVGVVILAWVMRIILTRENRKLREVDSGVINLYAY
ncbi:major facilitator superfamily domain-containing protein [Aspergillus transmontanensis]|uniref:Major facilitator superfamily domain-containing protein n=1 Tax=Aspergillus transmontanensis TaxID=1034304 RepID=A0A5N6W6P9_9EURO|nr:major facilitator superfamily domain-containing protein [Aspergillus transmontanensis]